MDPWFVALCIIIVGGAYMALRRLKCSQAKEETQVVEEDTRVETQGTGGGPGPSKPV